MVPQSGSKIQMVLHLPRRGGLFAICHLKSPYEHGMEWALLDRTPVNGGPAGFRWKAEYWK
jgi:hypothetical protein